MVAIDKGGKLKTTERQTPMDSIVSQSFSLLVYYNYPYQTIGSLSFPFVFFVHRFVYQFQLSIYRGQYGGESVEEWGVMRIKDCDLLCHAKQGHRMNVRELPKFPE